MLTAPDPSYHGLVYTDHYGTNAFLGRMRSVFQRTMGSVLSPFNAFLLLQGVETVALRVERHVENARRVAEFLRADARVDSVSYAGFPDNPYYELCQKYLGGRACSLLTFSIRGGYDAGTRFYDALKLFKRLVNLVPRRGRIIGYDAGESIERCLQKSFCPVERYGTSDRADWRIANLKLNEEHTSWSVVRNGKLWANFEFALGGE